MMSATGHAYNLLSAIDVGAIHEGALTILERMGMEIQNRELLLALGEHGAQVNLEAERVTFPRALVERFIEDAPKHDWEHAQSRVLGSAGVYEGLYHDPISGELIPWTEQRLALYVALAGKLQWVAGASMLGSRLAAPGPLEPLYERLHCWKYGAADSGTILTDEICPHLLELYEVAAAERGLPLSEVFHGTVYLIPALKLGRHEAYQVAYFRERGLSVRIGHSMPTLGATAPVTLAGGVTLNLAEHLALSMLNWMWFGRRQLHLGCSLAPMDMRTAIRPFGRPEMAIANLMTAQLARTYGVSFSGHAGLSDAKLPSVEAGAQKALSAVTTLLAGGNLWMDVGLLSTDEVCSPIQMVLDNELLGALGRFTREIRVDEETIGLETILRVGPGGHYLDRMHTARHFREEVWSPGIWSRQMLRSWLAGDRLLDADEAREVVLQVQSEVAREPLGRHITEASENEILRVIAKAEKQLKA
jgi:trimethylamine---corrinoid protein Co-methyltransferase